MSCERSEEPILNHLENVIDPEEIPKNLKKVLEKNEFWNWESGTIRVVGTNLDPARKYHKSRRSLKEPEESPQKE